MFDTHVPHPMAQANPFKGATAQNTPPPAFAQIRHLLAEPIWCGHELAVEGWWKAWQLAFDHIRTPDPSGSFVSNYLDTAFNGRLFMWDSAFAMMFAKYGRRGFEFIRTLDNFHASQHADGFICRELDPSQGDIFERLSPASTGPDTLAWAEWEWYCATGDRARLQAVLPGLLAYRDWYRKHFTWPDGTYFSSGWGCGMDNQPRLDAQSHEWFDHGHMSWIDTTLQAVAADRALIRIAREIGRSTQTVACEQEVRRLETLVNASMWNERIGMYADRHRDGSVSDVKTIGSYWALLADSVPQSRLDRLVSHLTDPREFLRPHALASLSADNPVYDPRGGYWRGGVWPPTTYMVLEGLRQQGKVRLAHDLGRNHLENVLAVFESTGTFWENYAPESAAPGQPAGRDFVGWSGLGPIAVLLEHVMGIRADYPSGTITWHVHLTEEHGVCRYPWGTDATISLMCSARNGPDEEPVVTVESDVPLTVDVRWPSGSRRVVHSSTRTGAAALRG